MAKIGGFRELRVYQRGYAAAMHIYEVSKSFPAEERYSLTDQIRRSSRSVCANIAEAWKKRRYPAAFVSTLTTAEGESAETQVWLDFARDGGFISKQTHKELTIEYDRVNAELFKMTTNPQAWCPGT
jgi:four helix bundle protein